MSDGDVMALQAPPKVAFLIYGPEMVAFNLQLIMYGLTLPLYVRYRFTSAWSRSSRATHIVTTSVFILNSVETAIIWALIVYVALGKSRSTEGLLAYSILDVIAPLPQLLIAALVTGYLARRSVSLIEDRKVKLALTGTFVLSISGIIVGGVGLFVCAVYGFAGLGDEPGGLSSNIAMSLYACSSAFTDVLISASLGLVLSREIRGFSRYTDNLLRKVIWISVRTAAYTSFFAVPGAILCLVYSEGSPYEMVGWGFLVFSPSLYTISLITIIMSCENPRTPVLNDPSSSRRAPRFGHFDGTIPSFDSVSVKLETIRSVGEANEKGADGE